MQKKRGVLHLKNGAWYAMQKTTPPADKILLCYAIKYYQPNVRYDKPTICYQCNIISNIQPNKTLGLPNKTLGNIIPLFLCTEPPFLYKTITPKTPKTAIYLRLSLVKRFTFPYKPRLALHGYTYRRTSITGFSQVKRGVLVFSGML